jgi:hypothetical protein
MLFILKLQLIIIIEMTLIQFNSGSKIKMTKKVKFFEIYF